MLILMMALGFCTTSAFDASPKKSTVPYLDGRIVGGEDADIANYPYQLSLIYSDFGPFCGASLLSPDWAITAAHCTYDMDVNFLAVRAGSTISTSGGELVNISQVIVHECFDYDTADCDIALLQLFSNVTVANSRPIGVATRTPVANNNATISGWGRTAQNDTSMGSEILQVVHVPIVDLEDCRSAYFGLPVTDRMLCAGLLEEGGKDACTGDSGGPLVVDGLLSGIVSWGRGCALAQYPGVYTNVASFADWIIEHIS